MFAQQIGVRVCCPKERTRSSSCLPRHCYYVVNKLETTPKKMNAQGRRLWRGWVCQLAARQAALPTLAQETEASPPGRRAVGWQLAAGGGTDAGHKGCRGVNVCGRGDGGGDTRVPGGAYVVS